MDIFRRSKKECPKLNEFPKITNQEKALFSRFTYQSNLQYDWIN